MSYSTNINKLLNYPETRNTTDTKIIITDYVRRMYKDSFRKPNETEKQNNIPNTPDFPIPLEESDIISKSLDDTPPQKEFQIQSPEDTPPQKEFQIQSLDDTPPQKEFQIQSPEDTPPQKEFQIQSPEDTPPQKISSNNLSDSPLYNPSGSPLFNPPTLTTSSLDEKNALPLTNSILNVQEEEKIEVDKNIVDLNNSNDIKKINIADLNNSNDIKKININD
jgi:hypothetical protein